MNRITNLHNLPILPIITDDEIENMQRRLAGSEYALQRVNEGPDGMMLAQLIRLIMCTDY